MSRDDLIQRARAVLLQLREQRAQLCSDEERIQRDIESANRRLEQVRGELASAPDERRAELEGRARQLEANLELFAAMARVAAANRDAIDSADEGLRSHAGFELA